MRTRLAVLSGYIVSSGYGIVADITRTLVAAGRDVSVHTVRWRWKRSRDLMGSAPHPIRDERGVPVGTMRTQDGRDDLYTSPNGSVVEWWDGTEVQAAESTRARMAHARTFRWPEGPPHTPRQRGASTDLGVSLGGRSCRRSRRRRSRSNSRPSAQRRTERVRARRVADGHGRWQGGAAQRLQSRGGPSWNTSYRGSAFSSAS
jgi:hypothetical protein